MTAQHKKCRRMVGIVTAGVLGAAATVGIAGQANAADTANDTLDVASLQQMPEGSLADTRGGAIPIQKTFSFLLQSIFKVTGQTVVQTNVQVGAASTHTDTRTTTLTFTSP